MSPEEMPLLRDGPPPGDAEAGAAPAVGSQAGSGRPRLPQNIGHRGYKAAFPENSMAAFHGALAAGAHAVETDLHLSSDGVVVLSHDATLKRCFGLDAKIADCDWSYLSTLKTLREPRQGMPRLVDLLAWLAQPELESVWVLLDIKTDDDPELLFPAIARAIASVTPSSRPWKERIVVGGWNENYLNHARSHLPGHPLAYIGFSLLQARKFLSDAHADVHFNLLQVSLVGPLGARFRRAARRRGRVLLVWTVNEKGWMKWSVRKGVDGVITDEVGRLRDVLEEERVDGTGSSGVVVLGGEERGIGWPRTLRLYAIAILWQALALVVSLLLWRRLSTRGGPRKGRGKADGATKM
ncbi:PLC-like phosphodiesterase [Chaetomidium leptoderma]|uniref:PLC-like phosphodiesterase n=1 Tax=Chaetomidium leptoderma TaxID=669021 RepID=A0AAN6ZXC5_9PEZI|nr:PLC-like phosphodiesterase [Chaetomidium leptoderma]